MAGDDSIRARPPSATERYAELAVLAVVLYLAYRTLRPVLLVVVLAAAIASLTYSGFEWTARRLHGRRRLASALLLIAILAGVLAPLIATAVAMVRHLLAEISELMQGRGGLSLEPLLSHLGPLGAPLRRAAAQLGPQLADAAPELARRAAVLVQTVGQWVTHAGIGLFLLGIALYYFYLNGPAWRERVVRLLPLPATEVREFMSRFHEVSVAVLVGNLGTAVVQGVVAMLGYWVLGVPAPLVWGLVTTFAALIPFVGTWLVWGPLALVLGVSHGWLRGALLAGYGVFVVSTVDNLLRPLLTRRGLRANPLLVFLAVFGGLASYGVAGLFLGPLVIALTITVVELHEQRVSTTPR